MVHSPSMRLPFHLSIKYTKFFHNAFFLPILFRLKLLICYLNAIYVTRYQSTFRVLSFTLRSEGFLEFGLLSWVNQTDYQLFDSYWTHLSNLHLLFRLLQTTFPWIQIPLLLCCIYGLNLEAILMKIGIPLINLHLAY